MKNLPSETTLFRQIAKDYKPKEAAMQICKYIEGLEVRISVLEGALTSNASPAPAEAAPKARGTTKTKDKEGSDSE